MTGSLQVKKDKYYIVINIVSREGKRTQKWIATGYAVKGNKKKAEQLLRNTLREYEELKAPKPNDILFSNAIRRWLEESAMRVDAVTLQGYTTLAEGHILPYFDALDVKLSEVDRFVLQKYLDEKFQHGRKDGKGGLSARSLRLHKNILYQTLNGAVRDGIIPSNPCAFVTLPQMERHEADFYNEEQLLKLFAVVKDEPLYPVIKVTAVYGLRRSEVLGLKWDSVNFDTSTIMIKHTVSKVTKAVEKDKTKNTTSRRSFPLMPEVRTMLLELKRKEENNRRLFGKEYVKNDYIFKWDDGRLFSPDYVSKRFARLLEIHSLPHIRFHDLRHSCASFLINQGFTLKDVQEWLGHADIKMTANIYGHLDVARKQSIADKMAAAFAETA